MTTRFYLYYNYILETSETIRSLKEIPSEIIEKHPKEIIKLEVDRDGSKQFRQTNTATISDCGEVLKLDIRGNPIYRIKKSGDQIKVSTDDLSILEDTIINLPAAVLSYLKNQLLLHCSSVLVNETVYAFAGSKGIGKTTLSMLLSDCYSLYGDDTLLLSNNDGAPHAVPSRTDFKLGSETIRMFERHILSVSDFHLNSQKKLCTVLGSFHDNSTHFYPLKKIFFLERSKNKQTGFNVIETSSVKKVLLLKNLVGIQYFPIDMRRRVMGLPLFELMSDVEMYSLVIPNGVDNLTKCKRGIMNLL